MEVDSIVLVAIVEVAGAILLLMIGRRFKGIQEIKKQVTAIDRQINNRAVGDSTVSEDVADIRETLHRVDTKLAVDHQRLGDMERRVGIIENKVI